MPAPQSSVPNLATVDVAVDARCLQDERFRMRGVGQLAASVLAGRTAAPRVRLIGAVDAQLPAVSPEHVALFDEVRPAAALGRSIAALISPSPMTHSAVPFARQLRGPAFCAAIVHDFIPLEYPDIYLPGTDAKLEYAARLTWLRDCARFYANSGVTRAGLHSVTGIPLDDIVVMGIPVRQALLRFAGQAGNPADPYFLVSAGDDWRKNPEVVAIAHGRSAMLKLSRVRLVVFGGTSRARRDEIARIHAEAGGDGNLIEFVDNIPDARLASLYAQAVGTVTPSRNEGFSIPVIEAAAMGCPVLASRCAAHRELLGDDDLFEPDDHITLQYRMELLFVHPGEREKALARQSGLPARFSSKVVCERFWDDFGRNLRHHAADALANPPVRRGARPEIGFVTPMPPDRSGIADYSAATLHELCRLADVHLYTETTAPETAGLPLAGVGPLSPLAYLGRHDAIVSVLGNSRFHLEAFHEVMEHGGASIIHDARMLNFYYELFGEHRTLSVAAQELGRPVDGAELRTWLAQPNLLPACFLDEVARASFPMFVHSQTTAKMMTQRGLPCVLLPFSPYRVLPDIELTRPGRAAARHRLRVPDHRILVATFGAVREDRAVLDLLWAVEVLRSWGLDAMLVCIGAVEPHLERYLRSVSDTIGMADHFFMAPRGTSDQVYRLWLRAADFGIQLRTYRLGGLSGALLDCIAAGLPTVANEHLATAMDAPEWVTRVPDNISAVLIAEAIAAQVEARAHRERPLAARAEMLGRRGFPAYCRRLLAGLGFDPPPEPIP